MSIFELHASGQHGIPSAYEPSSSHSAQDQQYWRKRFISLAEDMMMQCGQPAAASVDDPHEYLSITVQTHGMTFELLHFPGAQERLLAHCRIGPLPNDPEACMLRSALALNLPLARAHTGMFVIDKASGDLIYSTAESLRTATAENLLPDLADMADATRQWKLRHMQQAY